MKQSKRNKSEELLAESMVYERAYSRLAAILEAARIERKRDNAEKKESGEERDRSHDILVSGLVALLDSFREDADKYYEASRRTRLPFDEGYQLLLNQIMVSAAEDYEIALSGDRDENDIEKIEEFGDILGQRARDILRMIRINQVEFSKIARNNVDRIVQETKTNRRRGEPLSRNTVRCPNCGGRLYANKEFGSYRVHCTGCCFFEVVKRA